LEKIITKKNHVGKHCSNLQCFMRKYAIVILNQFNIKNNKIDKDNFEKNHNKNKIHTEKHYSNPQCFKEKNYNAKFSTSSI